MVDKRKIKVEVEGKSAPDTGEGAVETLAEEAQVKENGDKLEEAERDADFSQLGTLRNLEHSNHLEELNILKQEVAENHAKYLRALADLENYRKRSIKERSDLLKYQGEKILFDLLPVLDNLELALAHKDSNIEQLRSGLELIYKLFVDTLAKWKVLSESAQDQVFNPEKHHAISKLYLPEAEPGRVVNEFKKAYFYGDRLLRPAEVVVAVAAPEAPAEEGPQGGDDTEGQGGEE